jgi:hypothetical protein
MPPIWRDKASLRRLSPDSSEVRLFSLPVPTCFQFGIVSDGTWLSNSVWPSSSTGNLVLTEGQRQADVA